MKVVVDTNCLQSMELEAFLDLSPANTAVLPDYVVMEILKSGDLRGVRAASAILQRYPDQVVALKGTADVNFLDPAVSNFATTLIDAPATQVLREIWRLAEAHPETDEYDPSSELGRLVAWARGHMQVMVDGMAGDEDMAEFRAFFTAEQLAAIRREEPITQDMAWNLYRAARAIADGVFEAKPDVVRPTEAERLNHFTARHALTVAIYMLHRVRIGADRRGAAKQRNDMIDALLVTFGTYFDGVMSEDALANALFWTTHDALVKAGARVGGHYDADYAEAVFAHARALHPGA